MNDKNKNNKMPEISKPYMNPYLAGILLGLVLLCSFVVLGVGLGASSGIARLGAGIEGCLFKTHTLSGEYFGKWGEQPLSYYLVFMFIGIILGGMLSALQTNRLHSLLVEKGKKSTTRLRLVFALIGGLLVGFASRLANGCTSGQALTGSAMLLTGSIIFLICIFAGGYAAAYFVRRQWYD
jgi:uncharacterized protein